MAVLCPPGTMPDRGEQDEEEMDKSDKSDR
jgi:hypothetical protein